MEKGKCEETTDKKGSGTEVQGHWSHKQPRKQELQFPNDAVDWAIFLKFSIIYCSGSGFLISEMNKL